MANEKNIELRKLSEIIFDMLSENMPEKEIITTLQQYGLSEKQANRIIERSNS